MPVRRPNAESGGSVASDVIGLIVRNPIIVLTVSLNVVHAHDLLDDSKVSSLHLVSPPGEQQP